MKLKNIILFGTAVMALTACDDLIKPALENNQEITEMYNDPQFARGLIDNAFLVLPYDGSSVSLSSYTASGGMPGGGGPGGRW